MVTTRALVILLAAALLVPAAGNAGERRFEKKFDVHPGGTLDLKTDVGTVKVKGSDAAEVSIVADIHGRDKEVNAFEISADQSGDNVTVIGRGEHHGSWFFGSGDGLDVDYTIKVPRSYNLRIKTAGGDVYVSDVKGEVNGHTSGGNAGATQIEGNVDLNTSGGNVKADQVKGELHLETSGGEVSATQITGNVQAGTSGGNVFVSDVEGSVRAETSGGNVTVRVRGGNKGVHAETSGGDIEIAIAKNSGATIDASTSGGDVVCDIPVTMQGRISESRISGTVNGGGPAIYAHTSGGSVRIRSLD